MKAEAIMSTIMLFALSIPGIVKAKATNYKASVEIKREVTNSKFDSRKRHIFISTWIHKSRVDAACKILVSQWNQKILASLVG